MVKFKPGDVIFWWDKELEDVMSGTVDSVGTIGGATVYITQEEGERVYADDLCDEDGHPIRGPFA